MALGKGPPRLPSPPRRLSLKMEPRRRRFLLLTTLFALAVCLYKASSSIPYPAELRSSTNSSPGHSTFAAANATLGFGAILAVSHAASPRRKSLLTAASITDLHITIPDQPVWTDQDLVAFRDPTTSTITRGSALAWLGHLNALRWFLSTDLETVLILEDDVDWDIHLRSTQIPSVAAAARTLIDRERHGLPKTDSPEPPSSFLSPVQAGGYWGPTSAQNASWDIMYLGHCGDIFPAQTWHNSSSPKYPSRLSFPDSSLPARENLHDFTKSFLFDLDIPEQTRLMHKSVSPLCTFGFALTRPAAEKLLYSIASKETPGGCQAYDVRILEACRDLGFKCWTSNPELFHHQDRPSLIADVDKEGKVKGKSKQEIEDEEDRKWKMRIEEEERRKGMSVEERLKLDAETAGRETEADAGGRRSKEKEREKLREKGKGVVTETGVDKEGRLIGAAPNIKCGIRGVGMFSEDERTLEYLREVVGRQGRCLKDEFAEEMSKWA